MRTLQQLARFLARKYLEDRSRFAGLAETLTEIRLLLEREVDFRREQRTLAAAARVYGAVPGVRVPRWIEPLSTESVTALSYEPGVKVTQALRRQPGARARLAERLAEALVAVPALHRRPDILFHADPHAGNLLYDRRRDELVIVDWALTERLSRQQRRLVSLLILMTALRDAGGIAKAIEQLAAGQPKGGPSQSQTIRACVNRFLAALPVWHAAGALEALELLDDIAKEGVRFPAPLVMFRKAFFTLDGVLEDVAGARMPVDSVLARYALRHWMATGLTLWSLLTLGDWLALEWSALTFAGRLLPRAVNLVAGPASAQTQLEAAGNGGR